MLLDLSKKHNWTYTRFIDDLSFSSPKKIKRKHIRAIEGIIHAQGYRINERKLRLSKIKHQPEVTGLILKKKKPDISPRFLKKLKQHIKLYHMMTEEDIQNRQMFPARLIERYHHFISGQLNFVKFVRSEGDKDYIKMVKQFQPRGY